MAPRRLALLLSALLVLTALRWSSHTRNSIDPARPFIFHNLPPQEPRLACGRLRDAACSDGGPAKDGAHHKVTEASKFGRRSIGLLAVAGATGTGVRAAWSAEVPVTSEVDIYFGQGCFWHLQHDLTLLESKLLGRAKESVTASSGYAGGKQKGKQLVCYHNLDYPRRDYAELGHAEVVSLSNVPAGKLHGFAKAYFDAVVDTLPAGRPDPQDEGADYRSLLGLPGGSKSFFFPEIIAANGGRLQLAIGQGSDPDTAGTKVVWIYDSDKFPFYQAELYHQFHDDSGTRYPQDYHQLKDALLSTGRLQVVDCPEKELSDDGGGAEDDLGKVDSFSFGGEGTDPFSSLLGIAAPKNAPPPPRNRIGTPAAS